MQRTIGIRNLVDRICNGKRNICYGAGEYSTYLLKYLFLHNIQLDYFVVTQSSNEIKTLFGIPVIGINEVVNIYEYNWIVGVSEKYQDKIKITLENKSIKPIYWMNKKDIADINKEILEENRCLHNIAHAEDRCFIMGTGGSIKNQNIRLLKGEKVFTCSYCSLMDDYSYVAPQYYIFPALTRDIEFLTEKKDSYIKNKLLFLEKTITSEMIFCDINDYNYINYYNVFRGRKVYYLCQNGTWTEGRKNIYDLSKNTPQIQTASIMMLKVAMYMGFKKIYLIGTEHDLVSKSYGHAYDLNVMGMMGYNELQEIMKNNAQNINRMYNREKLSISLKMFNQYFYLHNIAKQNGIEIYNATIGGDLDEFKRVKYEMLF